MLRIHESEAACVFRREFWEQKAIAVEWVDGDTDQILKEKKIEIVLIDPGKSLELIKKTGRQSREMLLLGYFDHFELREKQYWPEAFGKKSFRELIVTKAKQLDLADWVYVTGSSAWARLACMTAFDIGFRKIRILNDDNAQSDKLIEDFKRFCFGLEITPLERSQMTLQPNNAALLINSEFLSQDNELLVTLMYLNFIHRGGLIVDMEFQNDGSPLCKEGEASGFECLTGPQVRGALDFEILESHGLISKGKRETYLQEWQQFLATKAPSVKTSKQT